MQQNWYTKWNFLDTRVINDWNSFTSDVVEISSEYNFKSAIDNFFHDSKFVCMKLLNSMYVNKNVCNILF